MTTPLWNEETESETPAIELLQALGWTFVPSFNLDADREGPKEVVLVRRLEAALKRLNPWISDDNVHKAVRAITHVQAAGLIDATRRFIAHLFTRSPSNKTLAMAEAGYGAMFGSSISTIQPTTSS